MRLENKAAVVTGAGRGIGRAIALHLAQQGARVVVNDPGLGRNGEAATDRPADEVVAEIIQRGGHAVANLESVADHQQAGRMVQQCIDTFGTIDILVNSAGVLRERMIWNMTEEEFDTVIATHLKGQWNMSHHAIRHMRKMGFGRIINLSSDAFKGTVGQCNYAAAKAGSIGLTRSIAKEAAKFGITANALCPVADTRMTATPEVFANRRRKLEMGVITQAQYDAAMQAKGPEHIAPLVGYLCLESSYFINGQTFHVEKGIVSTYYFGEDRNSLLKVGDDPFTIEEIEESLPRALLNGVPPMVPPVRPEDAEKAGDKPARTAA
jgi:NAD(P)-dependent dehydrogenase (short-subunit alcohol dehydrogenase family)